MSIVSNLKDKYSLFRRTVNQKGTTTYDEESVFPRKLRYMFTHYQTI